MHAARSSNGYGPNPIDHREIEAWCNLYRIDLDAWEIRVVRQLDNIYRRVFNRQPASVE